MIHVAERFWLPQHNLYDGRRGFDLVPTTAMLSRLVIEYGEIVANTETPPALRTYAQAVLAELRDEIRARALHEGQGA